MLKFCSGVLSRELIKKNIKKMVEARNNEHYASGAVPDYTSWELAACYNTYNDPDLDIHSVKGQKADDSMSIDEDIVFKPRTNFSNSAL